MFPSRPGCRSRRQEPETLLACVKDFAVKAKRWHKPLVLCFQWPAYPTDYRKLRQFNEAGHDGYQRGYATESPKVGAVKPALHLLAKPAVATGNNAGPADL